MATASAQLKILSSTNHKKIQKFSGHPVSAYLDINHIILACLKLLINNVNVLGSCSLHGFF